MAATKADIIARLQRDLLPLQGFKPITMGKENIDLGLINHSFPNHVFPLGAVHEFISFSNEATTATAGFVSAIATQLLKKNGVAIWISSSRSVFPPALIAFNIDPDKIIFIDLHKEKDCLWAMEEALKCEGLSAVICETQDLSFTISRRFQLAVEQTGVTGFILRKNPRNHTTTACITRWKITSLSSELEDDMPGVGFPRWNVELLKVRNGKPGSWEMEWIAGSFKHIRKATIIHEEQQKKTG